MRAPDATRCASAQSIMAGPPTATSGITGVRSVLAVVLPAFFVEGLRHPLDQALRHAVLALVGDDLAQLGLELGGPVARAAPVEVDADLFATRLGELAVEIVVQLVHRLLAVHAGAEQRVGPDGARG